MIAYSHLTRLLKQRQLSISELHRRILDSGVRINVKSLYRLSNETEPVERLDMRVAGAICQSCEVSLADWIVFEAGEEQFQMLSAAKQARLSQLMTDNNNGQLTPDGRRELDTLIQEAGELTLANSRLLLRQQERMAAHSETARHAS